MRLVRDPGLGEVEVSASAEELARLAHAVQAGAGTLRSERPPGSGELAGVVVGADAGPGVRVHVDVDAGLLVVSGDEAGRAVLAENLRAMAAAEDGGHLHVDHFPDHPYLVEGSVPLVVTSPHGGMPAG